MEDDEESSPLRAVHLSRHQWPTLIAIVSRGPGVARHAAVLQQPVRRVAAVERMLYT